MATDREIALQQALFSVIGAASELGLDVQVLVDKASFQIMDHTKYRQVDHPYVTMACGEIGASAALVLQAQRG